MTSSIEVLKDQDVKREILESALRAHNTDSVPLRLVNQAIYQACVINVGGYRNGEAMENLSDQELPDWMVEHDIMPRSIFQVPFNERCIRAFYGRICRQLGQYIKKVEKSWNSIPEQEKYAFAPFTTTSELYPSSIFGNYDYSETKMDAFKRLKKDYQYISEALKQSHTGTKFANNSIVRNELSNKLYGYARFFKTWMYDEQNMSEFNAFLKQVKLVNGWTKTSLLHEAKWTNMLIDQGYEKIPVSYEEDRYQQIDVKARKSGIDTNYQIKSLVSDHVDVITDKHEILEVLKLYYQHPSMGIPGTNAKLFKSNSYRSEDHMPQDEQEALEEILMVIRPKINEEFEHKGQTKYRFWDYTSFKLDNKFSDQVDHLVLALYDNKSEDKEVDRFIDLKLDNKSGEFNLAFKMLALDNDVIRYGHSFTQDTPYHLFFLRGANKGYRIVRSSEDLESMLES